MRILISGLAVLILWPGPVRGAYTTFRTAQPTLRQAASKQAAALSARVRDQSWKVSLNTLPLYAQAQAARSPTGLVQARQVSAYPPNPVTIDALLAQRALNPARFDFYHGSLGPILQDAAQIRAASGVNCTPVNGLLPPSPYFNDLRYRRSLNPNRFDYYHPILGALLAEDERLRNLPPCPPQPGTVTPPDNVFPPPPPDDPPPVIIQPPPIDNDPPVIIQPPPIGGGDTPPPVEPPPVEPPPVTPPPVPEPSSYALLTLGLAAALGLRWRRRLHDSDKSPEAA